MTAVLGVSCFYHDSAAALVVGEDLVAAAQQERFSRVKHDSIFPIDAIRYCLDHRGLRLSELDAVVFYEEPDHKLFRILQTLGQDHPNRRAFLASIMPEWLQHPGLIQARLLKGLSRIDPAFDPAKLRYSAHHRSHAASAFFLSPFSCAAVLTVDGVGEFATTSIYRGEGPKLTLLKQIEFPNSLGLLYAALTAYLGFRVNDGEYKVMGLAPYGEPRFAEKIKSELITLHADGSYTLNQQYFDFFTGDRMYNERLEALFGQPSRAGGDAPMTSFHMDVAASIQAVTTEVVLGLARVAVRESGQRDLCLAGGVALNCVANGHLLRSGIVDRLWIQPAAGDAGGAVGAAFVGATELNRREVPSGVSDRVKRSFRQIKNLLSRPLTSDRMHGSYLGPEFSQQDIEKYLTSIGATFEVLPDDAALVQAAVGHLTSGQVVGWYQGRMEFGPRALGNRSILADPRSPEMQAILNTKTKDRESFRPFAPAIPLDAAKDWFSLDVPSPYMLLVSPVEERHRLPVPDTVQGLDRLAQHRSTIPAVTHVDYSARVQTVDGIANPLFLRLLTAFKAATGVPILVNTSFNVSDEPIVCSPKDAYRCFLGTQIDVLVMGRCVMRREDQRVVLQAALDVPAVGIFEIQNRYCVQWYANDRMHVLRNRMYQRMMSTENLIQPVPTTEYETPSAWWSALRMACQNRLVVVTCGGSTTAFNTNWPYYLGGELRKQGLDRPVVTINLGQPLHASYDNFFLLDHFLRELRQNDIEPDLVLSFDGANDIAYRMQTFVLSLRAGRDENYSPNEVRLLDELALSRSYATADVGQYRDLLATPTGKFAPLVPFPMPEALQDGIAGSFRATLGAFRRLCAGHGIPCLSFLQPMLLTPNSSRTARLKEKFREEARQLQGESGGKPLSDDEAFDVVRRRHSVRLHIGEGFAINDETRTQGSFEFDWVPLYAKCSRFWADLNGSKDNSALFDLSAMFASESEEVFLLDGVHYTLGGAEKIAAKIAEAVLGSERASLSQAEPVDADVRAIWATLNDAGLDKAAAQAEEMKRRNATPAVRRELQALLATQGRSAEALALGEAATPDAGQKRDKDTLDAILARCSVAPGLDGYRALAWKTLNGTPPISPEEREAWASLAAELREMAKTVRSGPVPTYGWETERGELYPMY